MDKRWLDEKEGSAVNNAFYTVHPVVNVPGCRILGVAEHEGRGMSGTGNREGENESYTA